MADLNFYALQVEHVSAAYGRHEVLQDVSLGLRAGEMAALIGANGAGKTSLLRVITDWLKPTAGSVCLFGRRPTASLRAAVMAVVPQQLSMTMPYRVRELLAVARSATVNDARLAELMKQTHTAEFAERQFAELSGGEQQRVTLAMALAAAPKIVLLDEPSAHLDLRYQAELFGLVRRLSREEGLTVLAACHDLNLAAHFFPRLVLLQEGRVAADGTPGEVLKQDVLEAAYCCRVDVRNGMVLPRLESAGLPEMKEA